MAADIDSGMKRLLWSGLLVLGLVWWLGCGDAVPGPGHEPGVEQAEAPPAPEGPPTMLQNPMAWLLFLTAAIGVVVFVERYLYFHRVQINTTEFIGGLGNVMARGNVVEAISICEATPSPAARLVREAIVNRDRDRAELKESLEKTGAGEVARLERNLWVLATIGQIAPLLGLLGTVMGFMTDEVVTNLHAHFSRALIPTALGLAIGIPCYAAYNYLVAEVSGLVMDMEKTSLDAVRLVEELKPEPVKKRANKRAEGKK
jgi:biopolymer transport protein ExbB